MKGKRGFTLVELLIVIIIVGILAAVSIPLMRGNIDRARATEAIAALGAIRTQMRMILAEHNNYNTAGYTGGAPPAVPFNVVGNLPGFAAGSLDGRFFDDNDYTITVLTDATFTAQCDVVAGGNAPRQADVAGLAAITINQLGEIVGP